MVFVLLGEYDRVEDADLLSLALSVIKQFGLLFCSNISLSLNQFLLKICTIGVIKVEFGIIVELLLFKLL